MFMFKLIFWGWDHPVQASLYYGNCFITSLLCQGSLLRVEVVSLNESMLVYLRTWKEVPGSTFCEKCLQVVLTVWSPVGLCRARVLIKEVIFVIFTANLLHLK